MAEYIGVGGDWKVKAAEWIGVGGEWKVVAVEWIGVGGEWKVMYSALSVGATDVTGYAEGLAASGTVLSDATSTTASGGSGNYTYLWAHVSTASGNTPSPGGGTQLTSQNPRWTATVADATDSVSTWQVTVTDTTYGVTATDTITVTLDWQNMT
jgi:hypothetical protein